MDLEEYKNKVISVKTEAQSIINILRDSNSLESVKQLIDAIQILVEFVENPSNLTVLKNYLQKSACKQESYPLDNFCKNLYQKLSDLEILLDKVFVLLQSTHTQISVFKNTLNSPEKIYALINALQDKHFINLIAAYKVLKTLEGHNKTLIILGPNGSGKTSLANYLKRIEAHVKVIPALKPLKAVGYVPNLYNSTIQIYNNYLYGDTQYGEDLLQQLIIGLCNEHDKIAREYFESDIKRGESIFQKIKKIFDNFFEVQLDSSSFSEKKIMIKKEGYNLFDFNDMSDGERTAFFYIATVVAAPSQSFIIVDEPENHLNPAIYNKIWDRLISLRKDCQFIFISHTIDFINARSNFELVRIKNFVYPDKFEFEFLGNSLESIPADYIVEILGSRKPILFCEGEKNGYDYKIYEILFGKKYTVIATGNCSNVEKCVFACSKYKSVYNTEQSIGIIDSDMKTLDELNELKLKNIYSLKCNEIEMLLLDEEIFKRVLRHVYKKNDEFDEFKKKFFEKIRERKDYIIKRLVKTQIDGKLKNSIIDDRNNKTKEEIKMNLSNIFKKLDIDNMWEQCENKINDILSKEDYDEAIRYCCLEHNEIIGGIVKKFVKEYTDIALGLLGEDEELSSDIRSKYFPEIVI